MVAGTRASQNTVGGKRYRAPSGSPPRSADDGGEDFRSVLQAELAAQDQRTQAIFLDYQQQIDQRFEQLEASRQADVQRHRAEVQRLEEQLDMVRNEVAQLKGAAESRDRSSRASHLIVKGLPQESNGQTASQAVAQLFPTPRGETPVAIAEARRLGRHREGAPDARPRAVLVKFASVSDKHAALKHSKALRSRQIYLDSDLTPQQREIRIRARDRFQQLKAAQQKPFWREERLLYYDNGRIREDTASKARAAPPPPPPANGPGPAPGNAGPSYANVASPN